MATKFSSLPDLETKKQPNTNTATALSQPTTSSKGFEDFTIAIDWDPTALHLRYQSTLERLWTDHETVAICRKEQIEPVDLNHCLQAFTSEEKLEQWYHCSHCKGKKPATKKLQIWKLPPILIVHLKRFNCVNGKWVKSQKVVHFPFDDFDPTPYLASVPQETILRHKDLLDLKKEVQEDSELSNANKNSTICKQFTTYCETVTNNGNNVNATAELANFKLDYNEIELNNQTNMQLNLANLDNCSNVVICENSSTISPLSNDQIEIREGVVLDNASVVSNRYKLKSDKAQKRKRLISTSLTKTPIVDGEFEDFHQHKLKSIENKFDPKYKLYAVVSHSGMLNGGHYISYAANQGGSWYCYNDSSCREIPSQPNIDPSSAYLLFYERKDLDYEPYLPNIEGKTLPNASLGSDIDESDNDLKKMCAIS